MTRHPRFVGAAWKVPSAVQSALETVAAREGGGSSCVGGARSTRNSFSARTDPTAPPVAIAAATAAEATAYADRRRRPVDSMRAYHAGAGSHSGPCGRKRSRILSLCTAQPFLYPPRVRGVPWGMSRLRTPCAAAGPRWQSCKGARCAEPHAARRRIPEPPPGTGGPLTGP